MQRLQHRHGCLLHRDARRRAAPLHGVRQHTREAVHVLRPVLHHQRATLVRVVQQPCIVAHQHVARFVRARPHHNAGKAGQVGAGKHRRFEFLHRDIELLKRLEAGITNALHVAHAGARRELHIHGRQVHAAAAVQAHGRDVLVLNVVHAVRAQFAVVQRQGDEFETPLLHHTAHTEGEDGGAIRTKGAFTLHGVGLQPFRQFEPHRDLRVVRIRRLDPHWHEPFNRHTGAHVLHGVTQIHRNAGHRRHRHLLITLDGIGEAVHHRFIHRHAFAGDRESRLHHRGELLLLLRFRTRVDRRPEPVLLLATVEAPPRRVSVERHRPAIQYSSAVGADRHIARFTRTHPQASHRRVQQLHRRTAAIEHRDRDRQRIVHRTLHRLAHRERGAWGRRFHRDAGRQHQRMLNTINRRDQRVPQRRRRFVGGAARQTGWRIRTTGNQNAGATAARTTHVA